MRYKTMYGARMAAQAQKSRFSKNIVVVGVTPHDPELCELVEGGLKALLPQYFSLVSLRDFHHAKDKLVHIEKGGYFHFFDPPLSEMWRARRRVKRHFF